MKKVTALFLIVFFAAFALFGQEGRQDGPIDLILLLDTSTGMSSSYENVNSYITGGFLKEFLRLGDTFHLISFSGAPRLDAARNVSTNGDLETIIARMMLQYPIERGSNISGAISYAEQYITGLPARPKKIVIVTTGAQDTENIVAAANQRLSSRNATIDYVKVTPGQPIRDVPSSGRPPASPGGLPGSVAVGGAGGSGAGGSSISGSGDLTSGTGTGTGTSSSQTEDGTASGGTGAGAAGLGSADGDSGTAGTGDGSSAGAGTSADGAASDARDSSSSGITPDRMSESGGIAFSSSSLPWIIGGILLLLLIIGLIMLLASRRLGSSPNRVMAQVASSSSSSSGRSDSGGMDRVDHSKDLARYASSQNRRTTPYQDRMSASGAPVVINPHGPLLLNLFVEDQNTAIGKRNIHSLKSGYSLSVGGGKGDGFLIFLVPIPAGIGELRRNGSSLTFVPKKAKYFPDLGSNELRDCLNKTIRIISDKNYELRFRFEMYEDPLIALNRMLNSIKVPG